MSSGFVSPFPSSTSNPHRQSFGTRSKPSGSTLRTVVTSPPWAKDEPESPILDEVPLSSERSPRPSAASISHVSSIRSELCLNSSDQLHGHNRWAFALANTLPKSKRSRPQESSSSDEETKVDKQRQMDPLRPYKHLWTSSRKRGYTEESLGLQGEERPQIERSRTSTLRLQLPLPPPLAPFTLSHTKTPGWDTPWTPRLPDHASAEGSSDLELGGLPMESSSNRSKEQLSSHDRIRKNMSLKKKLRSYVLHNNYVPLFSRFINITFTTTALAIAIRIRQVEMHSHLRGAVGSSPFLAIIFAPATLVHVMIAIYLEYFGRPLGLWQTSGKLAHTLFEVFFICLWSAQLALSFDNYMTSPLNCTPQSSVSWYSELPPARSIIGPNASPELIRIADHICDYQRTLAGVAMVSLVFYVTNLVISLYRIFEKVKVRQGWDLALT